MAYASVEYPYAGGPQTFNTNFALGNLSPGNIKVTAVGVVDGSGNPIYYANTYSTFSGVVTVTATLPNPCTVRIARETPIDQLFVNFEAGADVTKRNVTNMAKQMLMGIQENLDYAVRVNSGLMAEIAARIAADAALQSQITTNNNSRISGDASLQAQITAENASRRDGDAYLYGLIVGGGAGDGSLYPTRAIFETAEIPAPAVAWSVLHAGRKVDYIRDDAGTAITSGNGVKGSPAGDATVLHWGASPTETGAVNLEAFTAALASPYRDIFIPGGTYVLSGPLLYTGVSKRLVGPPSLAALDFEDTFDGSLVTFRPAVVTDNVFRGNNGLINIRIIGRNSTRTSRIAFNIIKQEAFDMQNCWWSGVSFGLRVAGGQSSKFRKLMGQGSGLTSALSGSYHILVEPEANTTGVQPNYTVQFSEMTLGGGPNLAIQDIVKIRQCDGLEFSDFYIAFGGRSLVCFEQLPSMNITGLHFMNGYLDCVNTGTGTPHAWKVVGNGGTGGDASVEWAGVHMGNSTDDLIEANDVNTLRTVKFNGCVISRSTTGIGTIRGDSTADGLTLIMQGTELASAPLGLRVIGAAAVSLDVTARAIPDVNGAVRLTGTIRSKSATVVPVHTTTKPLVDLSTGVVVNPGLAGREAFPWTPTISFGGNSVGVVYTAQQGWATNYGNIVYFSGRVAISSKGSSTGDVRIGNLPLNPVLAGINYAASVSFGSSALQPGVVPRAGRVIGGGGSAFIEKAATNGDTPMQDTDITSTFDVYITGHYFI